MRMTAAGAPRSRPAGAPVFWVAAIALGALILGVAAEIPFRPDQASILRPVLAAITVFLIFSYLLRRRDRANLVGEIGFVYLALALAYTVLPALKFLALDFDFPPDFDYMNFSVLAPRVPELARHFWRHVLFIAGVALGYLLFRGRRDDPVPPPATEEDTYRPAIFALLVLIVACVFVERGLSAPALTYLDYYTRFDALSAPQRLLVNLCVVFKSGGYFVVLSLMFRRYRTYRKFIYIFVPLFCAFEVYSSFGARITAFTFIVGFFGFYHYSVKPIRIRKALFLFAVMILVFIGIGVLRGSAPRARNGALNLLAPRISSASEFEAVYATGFHLYHEREKGTLPPREWPMFFNEVVSLVPFLDHKRYLPQFWYARHYFPQAVVPPTTMGVIADSAIWGGAWDLLLRSLLNGAVFALVARWFARRRDKWWALAIFISCYATCVITLKYSVFYQVSPLLRMLAPPLFLAAVMGRGRRGFRGAKSKGAAPAA